MNNNTSFDLSSLCLDFEAFITKEQALLQNRDESEFNAGKQVMLLTIASSGEQLLRSALDRGVQGVSNAMDVIEHYQKHISVMAELTKCAISRLALVGMAYEALREGATA